jgi:SIR2-like domain
VIAPLSSTSLVSGSQESLHELPARDRKEPPWPVFQEMLLGGTLIPFLGAGASAFCSSKPGEAPPTGAALIETLAQNAQLSLSCGLEGCKQTRFDLPKIASYYQTCVVSRPRLDELITRAVTCTTFVPNPLYRLLARVARLRPMLIITTNYDDLLEKAFDDPGDGKGQVPYEVVVTPADELAYEMDDAYETDEADVQPGPEHAGGVWHWVSGTQEQDFSPILGSDVKIDLNIRSMIYKVHGSVPRGSAWSGGYLIAEEDYARFLGRMEKGGIVPEAISNLIGKKKSFTIGSRRRTLPIYSIIFLGYGMHDWNLRVLLEELRIGRRAPNEEVHYAVLKNPEAIEKQILEKRRVEVYDCDLVRFVSELSNRLS